MRRTARSSLVAALVLFAPAAGSAQQGPPPGGGRFPPPPDHWMTLDSLAEAVGLTSGQRGRVADPYTALNGVMRDAAQRRLALREQIRAALGGRSPQELPEAERVVMRARFDSSRIEMEAFQAEVDMWHGTIRNLLVADQQVRFDALPKPSVLPPARRGGPPGPSSNGARSGPVLVPAFCEQCLDLFLEAPRRSGRRSPRPAAYRTPAAIRPAFSRWRGRCASASCYRPACRCRCTPFPATPAVAAG